MEVDPNPNPCSELEHPHEKRKEDDVKQGEKVCIVCFTCPDITNDDFYDYYHIYILDLAMAMDDSAVGCDPPFMCPTLRLNHDFLPFIGFCVLGSTLYMVEDAYWDENTKSNMGRSVFTYKLPSHASNLRLERDMLDKIPDMHDCKFGPIAVSTPDYKSILVFSTKIFEVDEAQDYCDFEIYSIESGSWHKFPRIPSWIADHNFEIKTYTFLENQHVMLFHTDTRMSFTLDLTLHEHGSPFQKIPPIVPEFVLHPLDVHCGFILVGGHLCLTPFRAYDIEKKMHFGFPGLPCVQNRGSCITLLHADNSECMFCVITTHVNRKTLQPVLRVTEYKVDLQEYKKYDGTHVQERSWRIPPLPSTSTIKAFKFLLTIEGFEDSLRPMTLFRF